VVVSADGDFGTVDAVVITNGTAEVYNLTVDEAHTYFVGDGAWLVHNACPLLPHPPLYRGTADRRQIDSYTQSGYVMSDIALDAYQLSRKQGNNIFDSLGIARRASLDAQISYGNMRDYASNHHRAIITDNRISASFTLDRLRAPGWANFNGATDEVGSVFTVNNPANVMLFDTRPIQIYDEAEVLVFHMIKFDNVMRADDFFNETLRLMILENKKP